MDRTNAANAANAASGSSGAGTRPGATARRVRARARCVGNAREVRFAAAHSRGGALTEFVFLAMIMVPLLFGIPMIGKLVDVRQTAVQASRYAAWETTVGAPDSGPAELPARFFGERSVAIVTGAGAVGGNTLWGEGRRGARSDATAAAGGDPDGGARVEVRADGVAELPYTSARDGHSSGAVATGIGGAIRGAGRAMRGVAGLGGDADWDLEGDGLTRAGVRVDVERNDWLGDGAGGCFTAGAFSCLEETSVILTDGWSAAGPEQAKRRVTSLVPATALRPIGDVLAIAGHLPVFKELKGLDGAFGHVDLSKLPEGERNRRPLERYEEVAR